MKVRKILQKYVTFRGIKYNSLNPISILEVMHRDPWKILGKVDLTPQTQEKLKFYFGL